MHARPDLMSKDELIAEVLLLRECLDGNAEESRITALQARYGLKRKACEILLAIHAARGDVVTLSSLERFITPVGDYPSRRAVEVHLTTIRRALGQDSLISARRAWSLSAGAVAELDRLLVRACSKTPAGPTQEEPAGARLTKADAASVTASASYSPSELR